MDDRQCIILCNFNDKEKKLIKSYALMVGINDQIQVSWKNSENTIENILEGTIIEDNSSNGVKDRAIIFNNCSAKKVSIFIDNMKRMRIAPAMKAIVTETSINWTLNHLLKNLIEERKAEREGRTLNH